MAPSPRAPSGTGPTGAAAARIVVERLEPVATGEAMRVLRAAGRAWASAEVPLGVPVLLAGAAEVPAAAGTAPVLAGPDGLRWSADFSVPEAVAAAAGSWAVAVDPAPAPAQSGAPAAGVVQATLDPAVVALLTGALGELRELGRLSARLSAAVAQLADAGARTRAAEAEEARATLEVQRDAHAVERDRAVLELDAVRADRDRLRRQADEAAAELERVEARRQAALEEVRELRAKLKVSSADRARLVERLRAADPRGPA